MYDAEKEERQLQDARQRELQRIEETKQKAAQLGQDSAWVALFFKAYVCWTAKIQSIFLAFANTILTQAFFPKTYYC